MTAFMPDPSDYIQLVDLSLSIRLSTVDSGTGRAGFDVGSSYLLTGDHFKSPNKITGSYSPPGNGRGKDANLPISILTRINEIQSSFAAAQPGSDLRAAEGRFFFFLSHRSKPNIAHLPFLSGGQRHLLALFHRHCQVKPNVTSGSNICTHFVSLCLSNTTRQCAFKTDQNCWQIKVKSTMRFYLAVCFDSNAIV